MKRFKQFDLTVSLLLITCFLIYFLYDDGILFTAYYFIGGWQALSMLVHEVTGWFVGKGSVRRIYHLISLVIISMACLASFITSFGIIYFIMFLGAPVMAIFYSLICYTELKSYSHRPINIIK